MKNSLIVIKGRTASCGKAKGKVRVLNSSNDCGLLQEGEILVTSMTSPSYVPAMKKAVAVITDLGGVTCHAAIVSREFGIPCIVGAKNATQLLKDGDYVEIDADKGLVIVNS